jgi:hypothetical protein
MPRVLRNLKIREISGVDRGAGVGVKVVLMKRAEEEEPMSTVVTVVDVVKRLMTMPDAEFAPSMSMAISKRALTRDVVFSLLKARAEALRQGGESSETAFVKAYTGLDARIPNGPSLLALYTKAERTLPQNPLDQTGSERRVAPVPPPRFDTPPLPGSVSAPIDDAQAGDENAPARTRARRQPEAASDDDGARDQHAAKFDSMVRQIMREQNISYSQAVDRAMREPNVRETYNRSIAKSRRANAAV